MQSVHLFIFFFRDSVLSPTNSNVALQRGSTLSFFFPVLKEKIAQCSQYITVFSKGNQSNLILSNPKTLGEQNPFCSTTERLTFTGLLSCLHLKIHFKCIHSLPLRLQQRHNQEPERIHYTKRPASKSNSPWLQVHVNINDPWICILPHILELSWLFLFRSDNFFREGTPFSITQGSVLTTDCMRIQSITLFSVKIVKTKKKEFTIS